MSIQERIDSLPDLLKINIKTFLDEIGITRSSYSRLKSGSSRPSYETLSAILSKFPVNPYWLMMGEGEPILKDGMPALFVDGRPSADSEYYDLRRLIAKVEELEREVAKLRSEKKK